MEEWPVEKKQRIFDFILELNLPETGEALDFGCGNGEFTEVLKLALPNWKVYGMDISSVAIGNAKKSYPNCIFFLPSNVAFENKKFDFLFTHHVLEHVEDINQAWREIDQYLKKEASCLHVLPCGNQGSFEYRLCMQRSNGIDKNSENRFVYEDESHLRRLTTEQMEYFAINHRFKLACDYYSHQFYGALNEITLLSPYLIFDMINPKQAKNITLAIKLSLLFLVLLVIKILRFPANTIDYKKKKMIAFKYYLSFFMLGVFYPLSKLINMFLRFESDLEWINKRKEKNGSEMYLFYERI
jgi:SAM-dependent methyltransferase